MQKILKDHIEHMMHKLRHKRNILFRAFFINWALVALTWVLFITDAFDGLLDFFIPNIGMNWGVYMLWLLGIWKIAGAVLFLIPALAIWWEMAMCKDMK